MSGFRRSRGRANLAEREWWPSGRLARGRISSKAPRVRLVAVRTVTDAARLLRKHLREIVLVRSTRRGGPLVGDGEGT